MKIRALRTNVKDFDASLPKTVKRIAEFVGMSRQCTFKCTVCKHTWTKSKARRGRFGCPMCNLDTKTREQTRTQDDYIALLKERNPTIELLGTYTGALRDALHRHTLCGHEWLAKPSNLTRPNGEARGCPKCMMRMKEARIGKRKVLVRGYEDKALRYMKSLFKPEHIHVHNEKTVPNFDYTFRGSNRRYFPDMLVTHINTIVEVKSISTIGLAGNMYQSTPSELFYKTRAKARAVMKQGFKFKLLVMRERGNKPYKIPNDWHTMNFRQFKESVLPYLL